VGRICSGIINNQKVPITKQQVAALNGRGGQENIATGWHAIEFLLWGQDLNDNGPGDRSFQDFVDGKATNAKRRREYLKLVTELLIDDLASVARAWRPGVNNYRRTFVADPEEGLRRILVGLGSLSRGEMAGERLEVPLATQDQEDEQSCFSDNTHRDIVMDALGIQNVWLGRYRRADGRYCWIRSVSQPRLSPSGEFTGFIGVGTMGPLGPFRFQIDNVRLE